MIFGPFNRVESPTHTPETALKQVRSGEIWGGASRQGGLFPCVKAYRGRLAGGRRGVEFTTMTRPDLQSSTPYELRWYYPQTAGVERRDSGGVEYAVIRADIINKQP